MFKLAMSDVICYFFLFIFWNNNFQVIVQNQLLFIVLLWKIKLIYRNNLWWEMHVNTRKFAYYDETNEYLWIL